MRRTLLALPLTMVAVLWVTVDPALAKGQTDKVVISGPGIEGKVSITQRALLRRLAMGGLEDMGSSVVSAPRVQGGYELTRYSREPSAGYVRRDSTRYYPTSGGGLGYVFHPSTTGSAYANWYDGRWFVATPTGDRAMRQILERVVIRPKATGRATWPFVAIAALAVAGLAVLVLRRHRFGPERTLRPL